MERDPIQFLESKLNDVHNPSRHIREEAENQLARLRAEPGFVAALFAIIQRSAEQGTSQSWNMALTACTCLHMNVKQYYTNFSGEIVPREDKLYLCDNIFNLITCTQKDQRVFKTALCILTFMVSADQSGAMPFESPVWRQDLKGLTCDLLNQATTSFELLGRLSATHIIVGSSYKG